MIHPQKGASQEPEIPAGGGGAHGPAQFPAQPGRIWLLDRKSERAVLEIWAPRAQSLIPSAEPGRGAFFPISHLELCKGAETPKQGMGQELTTAFSGPVAPASPRHRLCPQLGQHPQQTLKASEAQGTARSPSQAAYTAIRVSPKHRAIESSANRE